MADKVTQLQLGELSTKNKKEKMAPVVTTTPTTGAQSQPQGYQQRIVNMGPYMGETQGPQKMAMDNHGRETKDQGEPGKVQPQQGFQQTGQQPAQHITQGQEEEVCWGCNQAQKMGLPRKSMDRASSPMATLGVPRRSRRGKDDTNNISTSKQRTHHTSSKWTGTCVH